ncbi:MAG: hypothetical protein SPJ13_05355 [Bacteroidales bacterium]|nr:hypothetical protein [Bacteroidales bacterium]
MFSLLVQFIGSEDTYRTSDLDILDSVYGMAFSRANPNIYTMTIEGYGDSNVSLTQARVQNVFSYFAMRSHAQFPIRYAINPIRSSCHGDTTETIRFEVPVDRKYYDCSQLPESRKSLDGQVHLENCVLVTFKNDPDACLGASRGCYVPAEDSTIRGYYASVFMPRGALYSVEQTLDTCPHANFWIEEHLDPREVVERYFLVPHPKQLIIQVGYVVLHSNMLRKYGECEQMLPDSIFVRFPVTQEMIDNGIRIYGKKYSEKGVVFKSLTTKKVKGKATLGVQCHIDATQLDTIFLAKRIQPNELKDYFYEVETDIEESVFTVDGKHYKAFSLDKHGDYVYKKNFRTLLRITENNSQEDEKMEQETDRRYKEDEEIQDEE